MADRREPVRKTPADILQDVRAGHENAVSSGAAVGRKYLENFLDKNHSIPNAVKFFLYDFLAEDTYRCEDYPACAEAVKSAIKHLPDAREEADRAFREYLPSIRCYERGISVLVDAMDYQQALEYCDQAIALGLGRFYLSKKASIEGMI